VTASWAREPEVDTQEGFAELMREQFPFHFADPLDPRIEEYLQRSSGAVYAPDVLRHFSAAGYGGIEVEDRLEDVASPTLVLAGRYDRTCIVPAAEATARGIAGSELIVFERSGHMTFVEEPDLYVAVVRSFLQRTA
jgi:proline iminopeptidase